MLETSADGLSSSISFEFDAEKPTRISVLFFVHAMDDAGKAIGRCH